MKRRGLILFFLLVLSTWTLLVVGKWLVPAIDGSWSTVTALDHQLKYQLITFGLAIVALLVARALRPDTSRAYFRIGDLRAPATANRFFGIHAGESWRRVGWTLSILITVVTAVVIWFQVWAGHETTRPVWVLLWVPLLAAVNAFVEEMLTRFGVVVALDGILAPKTIAIISGLVFGTVHYFGTPGGVVGVIVAGVLGWVLARSVLETRGLFWAWWVHFLQDIVIISALLLV